MRFNIPVFFISTVLLSFLLLGCAPGRWTFTEENDYFTLFNKDSDYTQGVRLQHETQDRIFSVGQRVYTPVQKKLNPPPDDERPYAGYLYGEVTKLIPHDEENTLFYGAEVGIVGPGSLGKEAQCGVHKILSQSCPSGWSHQLDNELGITVRGGSITRTPVDLWILKGENLRVITIEAGNVSTAIHVDSQVRWGTKTFFYYAGPVIHLVARNIFLDGNTFENSPRVDKNWTWAEIKGGIGVKVGASEISWFIAATTPQYEEQDGSYNYGGVKIAWIH